MLDEDERGRGREGKGREKDHRLWTDEDKHLRGKTHPLGYPSRACSLFLEGASPARRPLASHNVGGRPPQHGDDGQCHGDETIAPSTY